MFFNEIEKHTILQLLYCVYGNELGYEQKLISLVWWE